MLLGNIKSMAEQLEFYPPQLVQVLNQIYMQLNLLRLTPHVSREEGGEKYSK